MCMGSCTCLNQRSRLIRWRLRVCLWFFPPENDRKEWDLDTGGREEESGWNSNRRWLIHTRAVKTLLELVSQVKDEQSYIVMRERTHRNTAESTNGRVKWWSIFQLGVLIGEGVFQVWWLKRFFEVSLSFFGLGIQGWFGGRLNEWFRGRGEKIGGVLWKVIQGGKWIYASSVFFPSNLVSGSNNRFSRPYPPNQSNLPYSSWTVQQHITMLITPYTLYFTYFFRINEFLFDQSIEQCSIDHFPSQCHDMILSHMHRTY